MPLFSAPKVVIWPKKETLDIYLGKKDNNSFSFNINLWQERTDTELLPLIDFFKNNPKEVFCCLPDDVTITKSFIYDSKTDSIDKKEIKALAESSVNFTIDPDFIDFTLDQNLADKTIIRAKISDAAKLVNLQKNLTKLALTVLQYETVSQLIALVVTSFYKDDYFFVYPSSTGELFLILAKGQLVYLTTKLKGTSPELQKIFNYAPLYFQKNTTKIFTPQDTPFEVKSNTPMEPTSYQAVQIVTSLNQPPSLPIPVVGFLLSNNSITPKPVIIKSDQSETTKTMEPKKNILPIIIVFIITAIIASAILWFITNRSSNNPIETPMSDLTPTPELIDTVPTDVPVLPTLADVSKKLKIEVLNATDINGQAAKVKSELTALGFTSVTVGNSTQNSTQNEIRLKAANNSAAGFFQQKLASFSDATITELDDSSTYDVVIVIGVDLADSKSVTVTATSTPAPTSAIEP